MALLPLLRGCGLAPEAPCGGHGTCGKCKVLVDGAEQLALNGEMVLGNKDRMTACSTAAGPVLEGAN